MSSLRLKARLPSARVEVTATLHGHALRFHKAGSDGSAKCDAFQTDHEADSLMGVVFSIDTAEKPTLDEIEGVGHGYEEKTVQVVTASAQVIEAFTYYATNIDRSLKPFHWYRHHVLTGASEHNLPQPYLAQISAIESVADPVPARQQREMAIYP